MPAFLLPYLAWFAAKKTATVALGWVKLTIYGLALTAFLSSYGYTYYKGRVHGAAKAELSVKNREISELKRAKDEVDRLTKETKGLQNDYDKNTQLAVAANTRANVADARLRERTAEFKRAVASAPADRVRDYASGATDLYQACRYEYQNLGRDTAAAANAAHTLKKSNDLLSQRSGILSPVAPLPPLPPH